MPMGYYYPCLIDKNGRVTALLVGFLIGFLFTCYFCPFSWSSLTCQQTVLRTLQSDDWGSRTWGSPSILCWITATPENHQLKAIHIKATWAKRCDRYIFLSSVNDSSLPSIAAVPHESREILWNKTHFALNYIFTHYGEQFDYFFKADDDTYVVVENLRKLLASYNPQDPFLMGYKHSRFFPQGYPSGGAGYVLSRAALHKIVDGFSTNEACRNDEHSANEDAKIGWCAQMLGIRLIDSRDSRGYHHFEYRSPFKELQSQRLNAGYNFLPNRTRVDCCADHMVTFHYVEPHELYFLDYLIYNVLHPIPNQGTVMTQTTRATT